MTHITDAQFRDRFVALYFSHHAHRPRPRGRVTKALPLFA